MKARLERYNAVWTDGNLVGGVSTEMVKTAMMGNGDLGVNSDGTNTAEKQEKIYRISKADLYDYERLNRLSSGGIKIRAAVAFGEFNGTFSETLRLADGSLTTELYVNGVPVTLYSWVSATDNVLVTRITSQGAAVLPLECELFTLTDYADKYPLASGENADGSVWVSKTTSNPDENVKESSWTSKVVLQTKVLGSAAEAEVTGEGRAALRFVLPSKASVYLLTSVGGGGKTYDWQGNLRQTDPSDEAAAVLAKYTEAHHLTALKEENDDWWDAYWQRSWIDVGDEKIHRYYYGSLYYMACTARENGFAPGLYGNWITTDNGKWHNDYHLNYNMIAPFYGMYSANRCEFAKSLKTPLLDYLEEGRRRAKNDLAKTNDYWELIDSYLYGGLPWTYGFDPTIKREYKITAFPGRPELIDGIDDGILYPVGIGPWGTSPDDHYLGQVSNAAFTGTALTAYYGYTKDEEYFREIYPYLLGVANFFAKWCEKETFPDGTYRYNVWSGSHEASFDLNTGNTIGPLKNILKCLIDAKRDGILKIGEEEGCVSQEKFDLWVDLYEHCAGYAVVDGYHADGVDFDKPVILLAEQGLRLMPTQNINLEFIAPSHELGFDSDPFLREVSRNSIALKELLYPEIWFQINATAKEFVMAIRCGIDPAYVMERFNVLLDRSMRENYTLHDGYHGIEKAGAVEFINAMLLTSDREIIKVFPNWTGADASFTRLRERGAFLISASMKNGEIGDVEVISEKGFDVTIVKPWDTVLVEDSDGVPVLYTEGRTRNSGEDTVTFQTVAGHRYYLRKCLR